MNINKYKVIDSKGNFVSRVKILMILSICVFTYSCDNEDTNDCLQSAGNTIEQIVPVTPFSRILVEQGVNMVLRQDSVFNVTVQTGENLMADIQVEVKDGQLQLRNENSCNFFREYGLTTVYVTSPDISEIRSATQGEIRSDGLITVDKLTVYSENYRHNDYLTSGEIYLDVSANDFQLVFNGISNIYITGKAKQMTINMASGNGRFEGRNFAVENASIYHRSSNDLIVNVADLLKADLYGTGNLISVKQPATTEVTEHYKGEFIIE